MKLLVSANNPGGANALLPVVRLLLNRGNEVLVVLEGSARDIFRNAGLGFQDATNWTDTEIRELFLINEFDLFLAGTSMGPTIDKQLLLECRKKQISSVYILDSWVNYWSRFSTETKDFKFLPDYICVTDEVNRAHMLAENFPAEKIIVTGNPYFDTFTDGINDNSADKKQVLFISQPLPGQEEVQALRDLLGVLEKINSGWNVVIRLHPRDEKNKFDQIMSGTKVPVTYDHSVDIKISLNEAGLVFGLNSMVLFQAALAGKVVISYQPGLVGPDCLPSNDMKLSRLVTDLSGLEIALREYTNGAWQKQVESVDARVLEIRQKNATQKVINFIDSLV